MLKYARIYARTFVVFVCLIIPFGLYEPAHAQTFGGTTLGTNAITLTPTPKFPGPLSTVTISLDDYSVNALGATISWFIDGVEQKNFENNRTISVVTGQIGKKTTVRVLLTRPNATPLSASITLNPSVVDLILESDTYVPSFYKGRALPSTNATIRATALVHDGTTNPESAYTYRWSLDGQTILGGAVKGKNSIELQVPLFNNNNLLVEVLNTTGVLVGTKSIRLKAAAPELLFYEYSPLRGLNTRAIDGTLYLTSEEVTVYGEPFYMHRGQTLSQGQFAWSVNSTPVAAADEPNAITLQRVGDAGQARVGLNVLTTYSIPQIFKGGFTTTF